jgi:hypothetical protein
MGFKEHKYELIFGTGLSLFFISLFLNILSWSPKKVGFFKDVSFEMIRPISEFRNEYSLKDRELDKQFINPFVKKNLNKESHPKATQAKLVPIKKKQANGAEKKSQNKNINNSRNKLALRFIPKDQQQGLSPGDLDYANNVYNPKQNILINETPMAKKKIQNKEDDEKIKKTASDFMDLSSNPNTEKMNELILAYKKGEISTQDFYLVVNSMVQSSNPNAQSLGVYLCYHFPSLQSFSIVTLNLDKFNDQVKSYADEFLFSFNNQAKLQYLGQALQSSDIKIVMKAGEIIILGLQKIKNGQSINYAGRDGRGNNDIDSTKFFEFLLPIAENLKKSGNSSVASIGDSISQEMGPSNSIK